MRRVTFGVIGGGSVFTPELIELFAQDAENLGELTFRFMDIDGSRQTIVLGLCERIVQSTGARIKLEVVQSYEQVIEGVDYLLIQFRVGGEEARIGDELLGKKYRIPFVETVSVCGVSTFLRTYYELEKIAKIILSLAPDAWVLNFANPAGLAAQALASCGVRKVLGVCNASDRLLTFLKQKLGFTDEEQFFMNWRGLNHLTVVDQMTLGGNDVFGTLLETIGDYESDRVPFPVALLRRLGYLPNQYFQYYYLKNKLIEREQQEEQTRAQVVREINAGLLQKYPVLNAPPPDLLARGGAGYSRVVERVVRSLETGEKQIHYLVVRNGHALAELPEDAFVEVPCMVEENTVCPLACECLPEPAAMLIHTMQAYERLLCRAAKERDSDLLYRSMMVNPLFGDHLLTEQVMVDVLRHNAAYLPGEWNTGSNE